MVVSFLREISHIVEIESKSVNYGRWMLCPMLPGAFGNSKAKGSFFCGAYSCTLGSCHPSLVQVCLQRERLAVV